MFKDIKKDLIESYNVIYTKLLNFDELSEYDRKKVPGKLVYILIALLQLRNGCRICEAVNAFNEYMKHRKFDQQIEIKIAKSVKKKTVLVEGVKTDKLTKIRYRPVQFIDKDWVPELFKNKKILDIISNYILALPKGISCLKQRVRDYLTTYHSCNTHSIRFALINKLLVEDKMPPDMIAKFVGHSNTSQIYTYTQKISVQKIFDIKL